MKNLTVAITVDDNLGLAFNKRRQSRDEKLIDDLCKSTNSLIYISKYSAPLFENYKDRICVVVDPITDSPEEGFCFLEMSTLGEYIDDISCLIMYRWNRKYPADKKLDVDLNSLNFIKAEEYSFVGKSHDEITKIKFISK